MKALPFKIPKPTSDALIYQEDKAYVLYDRLHQHKEIQISYIKEGEGTLIVGDTISNYKKGDVLAIGSNLPHVFKSETQQNIKSHMLTLFFTEEGFGDNFFRLEELSELKAFFNNVSYGFKVVPENVELANAFLGLKSKSKLERFTTLLQVLKLLSVSKQYALSSYNYSKQYTTDEGKRMQDVMSYTMDYYYENITLDTVSDVANMTKNAFCKYFKRRTNKTYIQFLNELRIEQACKLLLKQGDLSIAEIAFRSGFRNVSNFNRQFKIVKKTTPFAYKSEH